MKMSLRLLVSFAIVLTFLLHTVAVPEGVRKSIVAKTKAPTKPKTGKNPKNGKGTPVVLTPSPGSIVAPGFVVNETLVIPPVSNVETPLPIIGLTSPLAPLTSIPRPRGPAGPVGPVGPVGLQGIAGARGAIGQIGLSGASGAVGATGIAGVDGAAGIITDSKKVACNVSCTGVVCEESTLTCAYDETSADVEPPVICTSTPTKCSTPVCICI